MSEQMDSGQQTPPGRRHFVEYFWFVLKNIIGWLMIITSFPAGLALPGPTGVPFFIVGFALITFPGKRRFTARVLRGKPLRRHSRTYQVIVAVIAIFAPLVVISILFNRNEWWLPHYSVTQQSMLLGVLYFSSVALLWVFGLRGVDILNAGMAFIPRIRRKTRPWMRKCGLDLLPPRRRFHLRHPHQHHEPDEEILEIHARHHERFFRIWQAAKPWVLRAARVLFVGAVFAWMVKPIYRQWHEPAIRDTILATNWLQFAAAALMFAVFLFVFRALAWRHILAGLGHKLPVAAAVRIWSFSELARYVPGVIWQVVGRVYLSKPYGVSSSISSASQILELSIFMLANIVVALTCLLAAGIRRIPSDQMHWIFLAAAFVPVLLALLHPKIFYGLLNRVLRKLGKPEIEKRLPKRQLTAVLIWTIFGLLWQSLAIWLLTRSTLHLPIEKWYVLAGAYCLAWTVGFSVGFLSPGGIGVREAVFIATMQFVLPRSWVEANLHFAPEHYRAFLGFLGVLLRLWAIAGELTMAGVTFLADYRGALNRADAPGRSMPPESSAQRQTAT